MGDQMDDKKLKVLVVEDERMFSDLLTVLLKSHDGIEVVGAASTLRQAVTRCHELLPDVVVLDLNLPDGDGLEVFSQLVAAKPSALAIILSGQAASFACPPNLRNNLYAAVDKSQAFNQLKQVIERLLAERMPQFESEESRISRLTRREREIFGLVGQGLTNEQIASRLDRSPQTIATHRKTISVKLRCSGVALMAMAARHHLQHLSDATA